MLLCVRVQLLTEWLSLWVYRVWQQW